MRVLSASKREIFFKLRLLKSLPYLLFSALHIAASMSVIGAVVGEWIRATVGIGAMIIQALTPSTPPCSTRQSSCARACPAPSSW
jgi:NitT/TauT family transport system permease protein